MSHLLSTRLPLAAIALGLLLAGCDGSTEPLRPGRATAVSTANQSATVGTPVEAPPSVRVETASGRPVPGVTVSFQVTAGSGSLAGATTQTDASGIATAGEWRLGTAAGDNAVTATVSGLAGSPVTFRATGTADAPARLVLLMEPPISTAPATPLTPAPVVQVVDVHGNAAPVGGIVVTAATVPGGADLLNATATTGSTGLAIFTGLAFAQGPGSYALTFTAPGLSAVVSNGAVNVTAEGPGQCSPARQLDFSLGQTVRVPVGASNGFTCLEFHAARNAGQQYLLMLENLPVTGAAATGLFPGPASPSSFAYIVSNTPAAAPAGAPLLARLSVALPHDAPPGATHAWDFGAGPIYEIQPLEPPGGVPAPQVLGASGRLLDINTVTPAVGDTLVVHMEQTAFEPAGSQKAVIRHVSDELIIAEDVRLPTLRRADGTSVNTPLHPDTMRAIADQYAAMARVQGDLLFQGRHNAATEGTHGGRVLAVHSVMPQTNIWGYTYSSTNYFVWDYWVGTDGTVGGLNQRVQRNADNLFMHEVAHMRHVGLLQRAGVPLSQRGHTWLVEGFARFTERLPIAARLLGTQEPSRTGNVVLPLNPAFGNSYFRDDVPTFLNAGSPMLAGYQSSSFVFDYLADQVALQGGDWRAALREFLVAGGTEGALDGATTRLAGLTFGELFTRARLALYLDDNGTAGLPQWTQYHQFQLRASRPAGSQEGQDPRNAWPRLVPGAAQQLEGSLQAGAALGILVDGTTALGDAILKITGPGTSNAILSVTRIR